MSIVFLRMLAGLQFNSTESAFSLFRPNSIIWFRYIIPMHYMPVFSID